MKGKNNSQFSTLNSPLARPGYKQTEVGVIPEDWEVAQLGDMKPFVTSGSRGWAAYYSERGDLFVRITNLSRSSIYLNLTDCKFVKLSSEAREGVRTQLNEHDVLISITADIGIVGYVDASVPSPAYINQHIALVRFDPSKASGRFVSYFLASGKPQKLFRAATDTGAKAGMSLLTVQKIQTALPPLPEQRAIAAALSDVDALLDGLDRLIAKKRDLKQAAMQQLLTGQTRLPGFKGEWCFCGLPEVLVKGDGIKIGPFGSQLKKEFLVPNGLYRVYGQENVYQNDFSFGSRYLTREKFEKLKSCEIKPGDFVITTMGTIGKCAIVPPDICVGIMDSHLIRLRIDQSKLLPQYLLHLFSSEFHFLINQTSRLSVGGIMDGLSTKIVCALEIEYPESSEEQTAIATVLSDMDAEIAVLEQRRNKTRDIKQAMMQELLTGKTRLV